MLGLITIFAKDIAKLNGWEQRTWAAHSTPMAGGVSGELFDTQMNCKPASTQARFGAALLREHEAIAAVLRRTHRFRAVEPDGLPALGKELNRLLMERIDMDALRDPAALAPEDKLGTPKALERLLEQSLGRAGERPIMAPLFGINDLRNADAHLGSSPVESGLERAKVDQSDTTPVNQGRQLLKAFVATVRDISAAIAQIGTEV